MENSRIDAEENVRNKLKPNPGECQTIGNQNERYCASLCMPIELQV